MNRWLAFAVVALAAFAAPAYSAGITGQYVEARTTDIWTGPCFANAEMNLGGKQAVLAWKVEKGTLNDVSLDGLGVVAVIIASDTLGLQQTAPGRALLIVDSKANPAQRDALVRLAKQQGGKLVANVIDVQRAAVNLELCECKGGSCAKLKAGDAMLNTRCIHTGDKVCGNESAYYPPLVSGVKVEPAMAAEFGFTGKGLQQTWREGERRGAYVGSFSVR